VATTINSYSVSLGLDTSAYVTGGVLARNETAKLRRDIEAARTPAENFTRAQDRLTEAQKRGAITTSTYSRLLADKKSKLDAATGSMDKHNASTQTLAGSMKGLVASYVGVQAITKSIRLAIDAEQAAAAFAVLTGSVSDAKALLLDVRDFANKSPVSLGGAQAAAKMMLAFNISVTDVGANLRMLGDISGGNQQRFDSLTLAFSQSAAAGRLMGQDLLQMVNAGFNPLQEISARTGESMIDLKARMEDGGISTAEVTLAFLDASSAGGRFEGMSDKLAETMGGKLMIAMADLELAMTRVGTAIAPLIIQLTDGMEEGKSVIDGVVYTVEKLANGLGAVVAVGKDIRGGGIIGMLSGDVDFKLPSLFKLLDDIEKRDAERQALLDNPPEIEGVLTAEERKADLIKKLDEDKESRALEMESKIAHEQYKRFQKEEDRQEELSIRQISRDIDDAAKKRKLGERELEAAGKKAIIDADKMRDDVAKGPGSGMEVGSAEAAKYMADQVNAAIADAAPTQGEKEIIAKQDDQTKVLKDVLDELKQNGFKRLR